MKSEKNKKNKKKLDQYNFDIGQGCIIGKKIDDENSDKFYTIFSEVEFKKKGGHHGHHRLCY